MKVLFWFLIFWGKYNQLKKKKIYSSVCFFMLGVSESFLSVAATGSLEHTVLLSCFALGVAHLFVSAEGRRSNLSTLGTSLSISCSSKMAIYELDMLGNLCEILWEANSCGPGSTSAEVNGDFSIRPREHRMTMIILKENLSVLEVYYFPFACLLCCFSFLTN